MDEGRKERGLTEYVLQRLASRPPPNIPRHHPLRTHSTLRSPRPRLLPHPPNLQPRTLPPQLRAQQPIRPPRLEGQPQFIHLPRYHLSAVKPHAKFFENGDNGITGKFRPFSFLFGPTSGLISHCALGHNIATCFGVYSNPTFSPSDIVDRVHAALERARRGQAHKPVRAGFGTRCGTSEI